jgi:ribosomal protein L11 methyltransferase
MPRIPPLFFGAGAEDRRGAGAADIGDADDTSVGLTGSAGFGAAVGDVMAGAGRGVSIIGMTTALLGDAFAAGFFAAAFFAAGFFFAAVFFAAGFFFAAAFFTAGFFAAAFFTAGFFAAAFFAAGLRADFLAAGFLAADFFAAGFFAAFGLGLIAMFVSTPRVYCSGHTAHCADTNREDNSLGKMSYTAVQIIARGSRIVAEKAAASIDQDAHLEGATYSILEEDEARDVWRIDAYPVDDDEAKSLWNKLSSVEGLTLSRETLADADWLAMALSGLPPVRARRFFVFGHHDCGKTSPNMVNIRIEAGAAFGTGHHGTTSGCLFVFDSILRRRRFARVLDVGAGTGVLAIAAAKTGSRIVVGTDIDPVSVRISRENARINRAHARFVHAAGLDARAVRAGAPYDLVFANILARPLVELASDIRRALAPDGFAILSGLLRTQERYVRAAYLARGFRVERRLHRDAWCTLLMRR